MDCDNIPLVPRPRNYAKPKQASRKARGYGTEHIALRALVLKEQPVCAWCQSAWSYHLHHRDHDPHNRARGNVVGVCVPCHLKYHQGAK